MAAALQRLAIKRHFVDTHLHVAATAAFVALTSGTFSGDADLLYLAALTTLVLGGPDPLSIDRLIGRWRGNTRNNHKPPSTLSV